MSARRSRNVHVLFVHGVGMHSRLSSLLQAYQSLRANLRSTEAPISYEDPLAGWRVAEFDDGAGGTASPRLTLTTPGETGAVYLYEVNYSALAGVIRRNQPLDLTALFVGFDLAVNVARDRLRSRPPPRPRPDARFDIDDVAMALTVQKLAGVFVAATVPILGVPSLVFRRFTSTVIGVFTRFFEDIATFALDMNGEALISAHIDRTVQGIVESPSFLAAGEGFDRDSLVIAAHSLGTVVTHAYLVRNRTRRERLPDRLLTFGSPIGVVWWLWMFLDFNEMDAGMPNDLRYFTWNALPPPAVNPGTFLWINVVNHLDPIASAFPLDCVCVTQTPAQNAGSLAGGQVHQRYIRTGSSPGSAHTAYFDDRGGFLEILGRMCGLRAEPPEDVRNPDGQPPDAQARARALHWQQSLAALARLRLQWWAGGIAAIAVYLGGIGWLCKSWLPLLFLPLYVWPAATIGSIAFFQRLLHGRPTKRTSVESIAGLPWDDIRAKPHRMRQDWRGAFTHEQEREFVLSRRTGFVKRWSKWLLSFVPSLAAMALPLAATVVFAPHGRAGWAELTSRFGLAGPLMLATFTFYLIAFAISEFTLHWRHVIELATKKTPP